VKSTPEMPVFCLVLFGRSQVAVYSFFKKNCPLDEANAWTGHDQAVKASRDRDEVWIS
jgi:hypothetical protein